MKNTRAKKAVCLGLSALLGASVLAGCAKGGDKGASAKGSPVTYAGEDIYPVQCSDTLKVWEPMNTLLTTRVSNFGETEVAKEIAKQSGINVTYVHPASGMETEQFNLMLASNELPDIVKADWYTYGGQKAINEKYILKLNDAIDTWAPNFKKLLESHQTLDKMVKTDEGNYYTMPFVREEASQCVYSGPVIRKDWLNDLGLDVPETIDDWEVMLQAFKDKKGASAPLAFLFPNLEDGFLIGAWNITDDYYLDDAGKVQYGPAEASYKDFLTKMNEWYQKGLLDANFSSIEYKILNGYMLNGNTGATFGLAGGGVGAWLDASKGKDGFDLIGAPYPVLHKGDRPQFGQREWEYVAAAGYCISDKCVNPELAVRFLDFGYSEKGKMLYNFGIEGKSYELDSAGKPQFTDFIFNNPDGVQVSTIFTEYSPASYSAPTVQSKTVQEAERTYDQQNEAVANWAETDAEKHMLPPIALTDEESSKITSTLTSIKTYKEEMAYSFIMGTKQLSEFDEYISQLHSMGLDEILSIYNDAVARYDKR